MSAPIKAEDSPQERLTKLLPADVTAAFLSAKAGIVTFIDNPVPQAAPVFWTFVAILIISPLYFWYVTGVKSIPHVIFLCASFVVFAISIATTQFGVYLSTVDNRLDTIFNIIAIVLPILWVFLLAQIFLAIIGKRVEG